MQDVWDMFRPVKAPVGTGITTATGIDVQSDSYTDTPSIAGGRSGGAGLACVFMKTGRIPVKIADGGFHSP